MFSKDIKHTRYRTARSLEQAFGHGAKLHVERKSEAKAWCYAIATGAAIGMVWYLAVFLRA